MISAPLGIVFSAHCVVDVKIFEGLQFKVYGFHDQVFFRVILYLTHPLRYVLLFEIAQVCCFMYSFSHDFLDVCQGTCGIDLLQTENVLVLFD